MEVGMSTACFFGRLLNEEALQEIGDMGIHLAEVFFAGQCEYEPSFLHKLRRIAREKEIRIRSIHAFTTQFEPQLLSVHPRQYGEAFETLHKVLAAAQMLGADTYVFHGPPYLKTARKLHIDYSRVGRTVSEIADLAADYGVRLCYETVHWCWYQFPDFAPRLLEHVSSDNLYFTLDMKQAAQSGYDMNEYIDKMNGRLAHVHVCDFRVDDQEGTVPAMPMQGQADWNGLRSKLHETGFDGDLMLEVYTRDYDTREQLWESYEAVRSYFA
ncbi:MAG: sugar phosphate isomerase/epimerase [Clostridia bacterium]|nr:sugar phosphate isomerase/epimerase [Clostridia bacterium]